MNQACTPFLAKHRILQQRCLDIACNNNVQDLNKLRLRLYLDSFHLPMYPSVWLLEVLSVDYQHYFNAYKPVIRTFLHSGLPIWDSCHFLYLHETSAWPTPSQPQISSDLFTLLFLWFGKIKLFVEDCYFIVRYLS